MKNADHTPHETRRVSRASRFQVALRGLQVVGGLLLLFSMATPAFAADTFKLDPQHAFAVFRVGHLGVGAVYGRFRDIDGEFTTGKNPSVNITVKADSLYTGEKKRDEHVKGPDFLNTKQFPNITFKSDKVKKRGNLYHVSGKFKLHGVEKRIKVKMKKLGEVKKDPWGNHRVGYEGTFEIDRNDYGIKKMPKAVGDKIEITLAVEGINK